MFAKPGRWGDVRGFRLWSRVGKDGRLRVALLVEVFDQLRCYDLARLTPTKFTQLAEHYGVGTRVKVCGGNQRAVELTPEFLAEVQARPAPEEGDTDRRTDGQETRARTRGKPMKSVLTDVKS